MATVKFGKGEFRTHKMVSSPNLKGWDTCDISAGKGTLWPVTAELSEIVQ